MEQRDYLLREIDKLAQMLSIIFSKLLALKTQNQIAQGIEITNQSLKTEIDLNIDELVNIPAEEFINTLEENYKLSKEHLHQIADILYLIADEYHKENSTLEYSKNLFNKCLKVYEYLNTTQITYSLETQYRIERIQKILQLG